MEARGLVGILEEYDTGFPHFVFSQLFNFSELPLLIGKKVGKVGKTFPLFT